MQTQRNQQPVLIETPEDFNFRDCLVYLGRSSQEPLHCVADGKLLTLRNVDRARLVLQMSCEPGGPLRVDFLNARPADSARREVEKFVRNWFDLDTNLAPFYHLARQNALLGGLVRQFYGLRLIKIDSLFQALCWAILGQQINIAFAYTLYRRFIESFGASYEYRGRRYWLFPTPEVVAGLSVPELKALQCTGKKAEFLIGIARLMQEGRLSKAGLQRSGELACAQKELLAIRGVGLWTANYVLMRCLGFRSAFPLEDVGLHTAIKNQLAAAQKPSLDEVRRLASAWAGWEAYAAIYLYRSLL